jgi:hypothetical protein
MTLELSVKTLGQSPLHGEFESIIELSAKTLKERGTKITGLILL